MSIKPAVFWRNVLHISHEILLLMLKHTPFIRNAFYLYSLNQVIVKHSLSKQPPVWAFYIACPKNKIMCRFWLRASRSMSFYCYCSGTHESSMIFFVEAFTCSKTHHRAWYNIRSHRHVVLLEISTTFWGIEHSQRSWIKGRSAGMIVNNNVDTIIMYSR